MSYKPKHLVRDATHIVTDMLDGIVAAQPHVVLVRGENVLLHREFRAIRAQQVTLLSGGGSGHEPAHAGYIGDGMLTGVVCGNVFASPSTKQVLAAIRLAAGPHGCLVIVKNYTGDRLNFGLAVEQARAEGLRVAMVVVGDDVAVVNANAGRRGLSGTVFVHKLAGAAAARGRSLEDLVTLVHDLTAHNRIGTMGVAIRPCTLPGQDAQAARALDDDAMELGLGIHGEPGVETRALTDLPELTTTLLARILDASSGVGLAVAPGAGVVLMVNNLGATTAMELYVVAKYAVAALKARDVRVERVLVGAYMTALDMAGFSLSLWHSDGDAALLACFDAPTTAPAWTFTAYNASPMGVPATEHEVEPVAAPSSVDTDGSTLLESKQPAELSASARKLEHAIRAACEALETHEPELTKWDAQVGDGDCGATFRAAAERVRMDLAAHYPLHDAARTLRAVAASVGASAGGTSGVLYTIMFTAAARALETTAAAETATTSSSDGSDNVVSVAAWAAAFRAGVAAVQTYGGATEGARTMLDALLPAVRALGDPAPDADGRALLVSAARAAEAGAEATKDIPTTRAFGRSGYVGEAFGAGVPDPGAMAVAFWLAAAASAVQNE